MAECVETRCEEDLTRVMDLEVCGVYNIMYIEHQHFLTRPDLERLNAASLINPKHTCTRGYIVNKPFCTCIYVYTLVCVRHLLL